MTDLFGSLPEFPPPDMPAPLAVWEYVEALRRIAVRYQKALVRCVVVSGADVSGGIPKYPTLDEWAVRSVIQLRKDYDDEGNDDVLRDALMEIAALDALSARVNANAARRIALSALDAFTAHREAVGTEIEGVEARVPYPKFCRHPEKCAGRGSCPRDISCVD